MEIKLRYPNITGTNEREQIEQIKRYLFQLVDELQFADNGAQSTSGAITSSQQRRSSASDDTVTNAKTLFATLKPLIIKSADIVYAYSEEISKRLEGEYVAISDFGTYTSSTSHDIIENSAEIERLFTNIQAIDTDLQGDFADIQAENKELSGKVSDLDDRNKAVEQKVEALLTVNAYIKSGLLTDEEFPVYGIEIGQKNNLNGDDIYNKYARFTADRLSFYDQNNKEVAYISDYKLYITSVEILYNLIGGGFIIDFSRGFTLKYSGGE